MNELYRLTFKQTVEDDQLEFSTEQLFTQRWSKLLGGSPPISLNQTVFTQQRLQDEE